MNYDDLKGRSDEVKAQARKERAAQVVPAKSKKPAKSRTVTLSEIKRPNDLSKIVRSHVEKTYGKTEAISQTFHNTGKSYDQACGRPGISKISTGVALWSGELHYTPFVTENIEQFRKMSDKNLSWSDSDNRIKFKLFVSTTRTVTHENIHMVGRGPMSMMNYQNNVGRFFEEATTEHLARKQTASFFRESGILSNLPEEFRSQVTNILEETGSYQDYVERLRKLMELLPGNDKDRALAVIKLKEGASDHPTEWVRALLPEGLTDSTNYQMRLMTYLESYALGGIVTVEDIRELVEEAHRAVKKD